MTQLRRLLESDQAPVTKAAAAVNGVQLMSIHKSKGLEFPIVILADLDHAFSRQDFDTAVLVHPSLGLGPRRVDLERKIRYPTLARLALEEKLRRENLAEEQRVLYVAMTRPKEKLILVDSMYFAEKRLQRLAAVAACPVPPESVAVGRTFGEWLLLALLCRPEASPLRALAEADTAAQWEGEDCPWQVFIHDGDDYREAPARRSGGETGGGESSAFDPALLEFVYPYARETGLPAKVTATQLKGRLLDEEIAEHAVRTPYLRFDPALLEFVYPYARETGLPAKVTATQLKGRLLDEEIAEHAVRTPYLRPLTQPKFRQEDRGLTAAERGTATHLVLQYLDFSGRDVAGQIASLVERGLLTAPQGEAVDRRSLERFLETPLAEEIRRSGQVLREYRFTLLMDAGDYDPSAVSGDQILLQGVVDCCFETAEGLAVVDFKTDHVFTAAETAERDYDPSAVSGDQILLQGVVDCCFETAEGLAVVDFKTDHVFTAAETAERAEQYRPQLEAYSRALEQVLERPVVRRVLYFLSSGETVEL